jgi:hypothetical protein
MDTVIRLIEEQKDLDQTEDLILDDIPIKEFSLELK